MRGKFRRAVCERLVAGEEVSSLAKELEVSDATLYLWKRQALIDAGRAEDVKSFEAELEHSEGFVSRPAYRLSAFMNSATIWQRGYLSLASMCRRSPADLAIGNQVPR
jgi:hypothetical protein